ncbi:hypothetical protein [Streptomyces sp. NPDC002690]
MVPADAFAARGGGGLMRADLLVEAIDGVDEAVAAVDSFDRVLVTGLLRPRPAQAAALADFAEALAGSPLASRVAEAAGKAASGAAGEEHFTALAAGRAALLGAVHDALTVRAQEAAGRTSWASAAPATSTGTPANLLVAARSWLCDLARCGWRGIDHEVVQGAARIVAAMLDDPELRRLAAVLDGFAAELAASCPGATMEWVPVRRWADLWARAMLLTLPGAIAAPETVPATGRLLPLGVDLQEHATAVQAQVHAVFEPADGSTPSLVRASVSAPKPDSVVGAGLWQLLRPHLSLLAAVGEGRTMELTGMPLTPAGDLIWSEENARTGESADAFATARVALPAATGRATAPLDRHPAAVAVPVFVDGYAAAAGEDGSVVFTLAGHALDVDVDRIPAAGPLTPEAVLASGACIGLLRWDAGEFRLQPLAVETTVRKKAVAVHAGAWAGGTTDKAGTRAEKAATDAAAVLRERAGRLLRK